MLHNSPNNVTRDKFITNADLLAKISGKANQIPRGHEILIRESALLGNNKWEFYQDW